MKFELIAIEDNTAYISEIKEIEETKAKILQETANELETLSRENLMKIFTVLKSYYEDYCKIEGYKMPSNHALTAHCYESELRAIADKLIFYRVRGNEYQAVLTAIFSSDKIIITQNDIPSAVHLMKCWPEMKHQLQHKLHNVYEWRRKKLQDEFDDALAALESARNFEL